MLSKLFVLRWCSAALKHHRRLISSQAGSESGSGSGSGSGSDCDDIFDPPFAVQEAPNEKKVSQEGFQLPFDLRYSYSETNPNIKPISFREKIKYSPFGPGKKWTGTYAPAPKNIDFERVAEQRKAVLGEPLNEEEVAAMVEKYRHSDCSSQINMGRGGVTHNMLEDVHCHWRRAEAVRLKCLGLPTLDMDNVCFHLEDKSGGKVIYRHVNVLLLFRGRNYDPKNRPVIPLMLFKPLAPIYPKLVKNVVDGLTFKETKDKRTKGLSLSPLMKLSRNGVYITVVDKVREAFKTEEIVRLDCPFVGTNDCKKIGVKLRDLVPCIPILIKDDQIILWRGNNLNN